MADPAQFPALLASVKTISVELTLARCVQLSCLTKYNPPNFLYTSGQPKRYNILGAECVYFSVEKQTAELEYFRGLGAAANRQQPLVIYWCQTKLGRILDLADPDVLAHLKLSQADLAANWVGAISPTLTQALGNAVATSMSNISAIRFPSDAAKEKRKKGFNIVIYHKRVVAPDYVHILGPDKDILQKWPM